MITPEMMREKAMDLFANDFYRGGQILMITPEMMREKAMDLFANDFY
jgi:hypothetical protein